MCGAMLELVDRFDDLHILYPVHLNPNVQEPVNSILGNHPRITLCAPLSYPDFVQAMDRSTVILSDSGGVQEEAPSLGKPVVVMREVTERQEAVDSGNVVLAGTNRDRIVTETARILESNEVYERMSKAANPYGDGKTAQIIASRFARML